MKTSSSRQIEYSNIGSAHRQRGRGFTLLELLIVIAIAAILTAILIGGFFQIAASNRRSGCQVNLSQIYNALRLYANDYDGSYPYFNESVANGGVSGPPVDTMGLWKLYTVPADPANVATTTFPSALMNSGDKKPVGIYLRNATNLHCPNDIDIAHANIYANAANFNPSYLSYQAGDDGTEFFSSSTTKTPTYQTQRTIDATGAPLPTSDANWSRQLMPLDGSGNRVLEKRPAFDTVILWCKWHRTGLGGRNGDIVLFADGSVKTRLLNPGTPSTEPQPGWQRTP